VREVTRRSLIELNRPRFYLHDPLAVAVAETQGVVELAYGRVTVDVGCHETGRTRLVDAIDEGSDSAVAIGVCHDKFAKMMGSLVGADVAGIHDT
jgi:hypothetical protein